MTKVLPTTVRAQIPIIMSKSNDLPDSHMTKVLPATATAQIASLISKPVGFQSGK